MPKGYGIAETTDGLLPWDWAVDQLQRSRNYWVCTTRADGLPHAMPVWGVWLDGALYFSTDRASAKGRNIERDPRVVVHLESGDEAVILEGTLEETADRALLARVIDAYAPKYNFRPEAESGDDGEGGSRDDSAVWYALRPRVVLGWTEKDFPNTATRWVM